MDNLRGCCFSLGDDGEIETNRFFRDSSELAKFIDKKLDKYDDHHSTYYTGSIYGDFRIFKRVNRFEHWRDVICLTTVDGLS